MIMKMPLLWLAHSIILSMWKWCIVLYLGLISWARVYELVTCFNSNIYLCTYCVQALSQSLKIQKGQGIEYTWVAEWRLWALKQMTIILCNMSTKMEEWQWDLKGGVINSAPKRNLGQVSSKITVKSEKFGKCCGRWQRLGVGIQNVESHLVGKNRISKDFETCLYASLMNCVFEAPMCWTSKI